MGSSRRIILLSCIVVVGCASALWYSKSRSEQADEIGQTQPIQTTSDSQAPDDASPPLQMEPMSETPPPPANETILQGRRAPGTLDRSTLNELNAAMDRGLDWLAAQQKENGAWSNESFPAVTALATWAFIRGDHPRKDEIISQGVEFMLSCVQPDGGIYRTIEGRKGGGLSNYNTAICMTTLHATGDPQLVPVVLAARRFVATGQHSGDDVYDGGFGYDSTTGRAYADLMNTLYAAEAMRLTQDVEDSRNPDEKKVDIDWARTAEFVEKMQNKASSGPADSGGFFYKPGESKAGTTTNEAGVVVFRSYASMTYAGLLALIYADVNRNDTRVRSAFEWAAERWTLEENPGMGAQGLYFFFNVLARSLHAYGADLVPLESGRTIDWREELVNRVLDLQSIDSTTGHGHWMNNNGRFWERDPVLVTAYTLLTLAHIQGK